VQDLVNSYQLDVPPGLKGDAHFAALARAVERAVDSGRVPGGQYMALLIDEAHDFEDAWLRIAGAWSTRPRNSLLVLYDDAQSIYQGKRRKFNFASVGMQARGRTSILRLNYRNTAEVLALAHAVCAQGLLQGGAARCRRRRHAAGAAHSAPGGAARCRCWCRRATRRRKPICWPSASPPHWLAAPRPGTSRCCAARSR
jgi:hypothetical protein